MSRQLLAIGFIALALLLAGCAQQPPAAEAPKAPPLEQDLAALRAAGIDGYTRAYNAGDASALAALYTDDAVRMPADKPAITGKAAIEESFRAEFDAQAAQGFKTTVALTSEEAGISGDWAFLRGAYTATTTPKIGAPVERKGKWLVVYLRQPGGDWKIHRGCTNRDEPLPAAK